MISEFCQDIKIFILYMSDYQVVHYNLYKEVDNNMFTPLHMGDCAPAIQ